MIKNNLKAVNNTLAGTKARLIAVSKTQPIQKIEEAYEAGQRIFGENKAQEMSTKYQTLPKDIEWHMIGHLQTNKVKYIAPFVSLIHSVDSLKLLEEINKQGAKCNRTIPCLLQVYIAKEESKFGFDFSELKELVSGILIESLKNVKIIGLMGMATFTNDHAIVQQEFHSLKIIFDQLKKMTLPVNIEMIELSMGMSADYKIALQEGSTLVRIGTSIFGERMYSTH